MIWNTLRIVLLLTFAIGIESANPIKSANVNDSLNKINKNSLEDGLILNTSSEQETIVFRNVHIDEEESPNKKIADDSDEERTDDVNNLKYQVEILQPEKIDKDDLEIEERYKGPSLNFDTDEFFDENIEVSSQSMQQGHILLTVGLIALAVASIGIYAGLVMWRSNLEKRYGTRQRLMTEDDFCTNIHEVRSY